MVTVAHITESIIKRRPFLQEALAKGLINYGALAEEITEEVQSHLNRKIKHSAIMMALRRYKDKLNNAPLSRLQLDKITEIDIHSNLVEINCQNNRKNLDAVKKLVDKKNNPKKRYISIGNKEITLIIPLKGLLQVEGRISSPKIIKDLAAIRIDFNESLFRTPGFYYLILRELAWENVNLIEMISTKTELNIIVKDDQVGLSFDIINRLIKGGPQPKA